MTFIVMVPLALIFGLLCARLAYKKNLRPSIWAFIGAMFGPIAWLFLCVKKRRNFSYSANKSSGKWLRRLFITDLWFMLLINSAFSLATIVVFFDFQAALSASLNKTEFYSELIYGSLSLVIVCCAIRYLMRRKEQAIKLFYLVFIISFANYLSFIFMQIAHSNAENSPFINLIGLLIGLRTIFWPLYFQNLSIKDSFQTNS